MPQFRFFGLLLGGAIARHDAGYSIRLPIMAYHSRDSLTWRWLLDFQRYRPDSGCRNRLFGVSYLPGCQTQLAIHLLCLGHLLFMWQKREPRRMRAWVLPALALILLTVALPAHAQVMTDPSPIVGALALILPPAYAVWLGDAVTIASILSLLASVLAASVKPPSANAANWLRTAYSIATWPALNLAWARNAVVPGMHPQVQQAALVSAKLAAAAPELTTIAEAPAIAGKIVPQTTIADRIVATTVPVSAVGDKA